MRAMRGAARPVWLRGPGGRAPRGCCFREHTIDFLLSARKCRARVRDNERRVSSVRAASRAIRKSVSGLAGL